MIIIYNNSNMYANPTMGSISFDPFLASNLFDDLFKSSIFHISTVANPLMTIRRVDHFEQCCQTGFESLLFKIMDLFFKNISSRNLFSSLEPAEMEDLEDEETDYFSFDHLFGNNEADYRTFALPEREDYFQRYVEESNNQRLDEARTANRDGVGFVKKVLDNHVSTLSPGDKKKFLEKISESDPELFTEVPKMVVESLVATSDPLTTIIPNFAQDHLRELEEIQEQKKQNPSDFQKIRNKVGSLAIKLARETNFIAAMEGALKKF
jgi:hypothetical protein